MKIEVNIPEELAIKADQYGLNLPKWMSNQLSKFFGDGTIDVIPAFQKEEEQFTVWLSNQQLGDKYISDTVSYLSKFIRNEIDNRNDVLKLIREAPDYFRPFMKKYIMYLETVGKLNKESSDIYRKLIPNRKVQVDSYIPTTEEIKKAVNKLSGNGRMFFMILAMSGIRLSELTKIINEFDPSLIVQIGKYACRYPLNWKRGKKGSYSMFLPIDVMNWIEKIEDISASEIGMSVSASGINAKSLRKFFYNFMISKGVPESVADFVEGRSPQSVGSMHYLASLKQAEEYYRKLAWELNRIVIQE